MRDILYVHGAGDTGEAPNSLFGYIEDHMSGGYKLQRPQMPEDGTKWVDMIAHLAAPLADDAILIGHSLGGSCLLQMIATRQPGMRAAGLVLIAPPFWGEPDWTYEDFVLPDGFAGTLCGMKGIHHLHSHDDEVVNFSHQAAYEKAMPQATYLAYDGFGHSFDRGDRAPVLDLIRSL